jgi:hypothetical protein
MVYLALEPQAAVEAIRFANDTGCDVWVGSDAITPEEHKRFTLEGTKVTRFSYPLANASPEVIDDALGTIEEHHPGEIIWVQHVRLESPGSGN